MEIADRLDAIAKQVDRLQLQLDAVCKHYGINLEYQPHAYNVNQAEQEGDDANG